MSNFQFVRLKTKQTAQICYSLQGTLSDSTPLLTVFVNGLGLPQTSWSPTIAQLQNLRGESEMPCILTYDRFGQGQTVDRDPQDQEATDPAHGHDCISAVKDMHQLIEQIGEELIGPSAIDKIRLVLVCNSIGGALVRLYAMEYPGTVAGILFLDSVLTDTDFVELFPDPEATGFDSDLLPPGMTVDHLRKARDGVRRTFHPDVGNKEGLSRKICALFSLRATGPCWWDPMGWVRLLLWLDTTLIPLRKKGSKWVDQKS